MARWGRGLLSVWAGPDLLVGLAVAVGLALGAWHAPGLRYLLDDAGIAALDPRVLASVDAIAVIANACIAALCFLALVVTWRGGRSTAAVLAVALVPVQVSGSVSDAFLGHPNLAPNVVSSVILVSGLALLARGRSGDAAPGASAPGGITGTA